MGDFKIYADALAMFAENNFAGADNCIFVAAKDINAEGMKAGLAGGMGALGKVIGSTIGADDLLKNLVYDALLINATEKGIGFIPLWTVGINLNGDLGKMEAKPDNFFCVGFDAIKKITVKDYSFLNRKVKKLRISFKNGQKLQVLPKVSEKKVPYQEQNFVKFMAKYL